MGNGTNLMTSDTGLTSEDLQSASADSQHMAADIAISVKNISKSYKMYPSQVARLKEVFHPFKKVYHRDFWALRDIDMEIPRGMALGIIGQNGCGKSTLLQIICNIIQPTTGTVMVNGRISALLELGAGFNREFSGRENVFMQGAIYGRSRKEMEERFDQIADFADIGDFIDRPVKIYSSGMYVRLAFAVAINVDPDILIVDEALAVGDERYQRRCYRRLEQFQKIGKTIIFVSHALGTVTSICSQVMLLDKGKIVSIGKPKDVVNIYSKLSAAREKEYVQRLRGGENKELAEDTMDERLQELQADSKSEYRFGTGDAKLIDIKMLNKEGESVTVVETGENNKIKVKALFKKDMKEPVIGFMIRTLNGVIVVGTNTHVSDCPINSVKAGSIIEIEFEQKVLLNPGSYTLTVSLGEFNSGNNIFHDRRMDVIIFKVIGKPTAYGLVNMNSIIRIIAHTL